MGSAHLVSTAGAKAAANEFLQSQASTRIPNLGYILGVYRGCIGILERKGKVS